MPSGTHATTYRDQVRSFLTLLLAAALALTVPAQAGANAPTTRPAVDTDNCTPSPRYDKTDFRGMWIASVRSPRTS